ncbi:MAG: hypothetical protein QOJ59_2639 [Thermomicrobiales bacterium]|nr:hypothetical protein [Thermomicrobiales bacterium]
MSVIVTIAGLLLIGTVLTDVFESVILPRRVHRRLRLSRPFVQGVWRGWIRIARALEGRSRPNSGFRVTFLGSFGPLALVLLFATWTLMLIVGFAGLHWGLDTLGGGAQDGARFGQDIYYSGTTFFTLGLGDFSPVATVGRVLTVAEAGTGFGFLALVVTYFPVFYQAFSMREANITLLDARAGSPPSAAELLRRLDVAARPAEFEAFLAEWERWTAQVLENTLSYPILAYYRSQHERQSWVAALTTILDTCALTLTGIAGVPRHQARFTFAMARHAAVDLTQAIAVEPRPLPSDRLPAADLSRLRASLAAGGLQLRDDEEAVRTLTGFRGLYEPHVNALADFLGETLPHWPPPPQMVDVWLEREADPSDRAATEDQPLASRFQRDVRFPTPAASGSADRWTGYEADATDQVTGPEG